jgi:4-hydroxybenzoate polyprenyltransferase
MTRALRRGLSAGRVSTSLSASRPVSSGTTYTFSQLMLVLLRSTRPLSSLVPGTLTSVAIVVKAGFSVRGILAGLAMSSLTAFGFQINDLLDYQKDKAAGVQRPIASGVLSPGTAAAFAFALLLFVFALSALVGSGTRVLAATALLLVLYTPFARRIPLFKGFYVALLCISPLYYGSQASGAQYPWTPYVLLFLFIVGREALMDSNEVRGD